MKLRGVIALANGCPNVSLTTYIALICKSLWIKASAILINVNVINKQKVN